MILVDKSDDKFYAEPISNFANNSADDFANSSGSNSNSSSVSSKSGFKTTSTPLL